MTTNHPGVMLMQLKFYSLVRIHTSTHVHVVCAFTHTGGQFFVCLSSLAACMMDALNEGVQDVEV